MEVFTDIPAIRSWLAGARRGRAVALVPTMGALHAGHRACIEDAARVEQPLVVASIFVNPTQFGAGEDLDAYPHDLDRDLTLCREWGCAAVFAPRADVMYPAPQRTWVDVDELTAPLCGRFRPGHFRGVATVVAKLFGVVGPDVAVFGQKDAQQALVIREMVHQLDMPVTLRVVPTVREADGLAMSSRNAYLAPADRRRAAGVHAALDAGREALERGERAAARVEGIVRQRLADTEIDDVDYAEVRSVPDLSPLDPVAGRAILAVAAHVGGARLIDNMVFDVSGDRVVADVALF